MDDEHPTERDEEAEIEEFDEDEFDRDLDEELEDLEPEEPDPLADQSPNTREAFEEDEEDDLLFVEE